MFGFPKADEELRTSFKRNFLRTAIFQLKFNKSKNLYLNKSRIHEIFEKKYPRLNDNIGKNFDIKINDNETPIITTNKGNGFSLKSNDGASAVLFSEEQIDISISGIKYQNFQEILEYELEGLKKVLAICNIDSVTRISIRKVNIMGLSIPKDNNLTQISKELLNDKLTLALDSFPMEEKIIQNISNVNYYYENFGLNLKTGHTLQPNNNTLGHLICDIDIFNNAENKIGQIDKIFGELNIEIFNIFIWFLNENSIKILKDE